MNRIALFVALVAALASAQAVGVLSPAPKVKSLAVPADATKKTVLIGRASVDGMIIMFELEPAKAMWMQMGGKWMWHEAGTGERFHVEVKPIDSISKARISHAEVIFEATNKANGKAVRTNLHPMWGGSGLHYAANHGLAGDGAYEARVTVMPPQFARDARHKGLWMKPVKATFHFRLVDGKLVEVSEPADEAGGNK